MKDHFPFTDYDFYAYLASGGMLLAVIDWIYNGGGFLGVEDWNFGQIVVAVAAAYIVGHIVAMLAQVTLETSLIGRWFAKPMNLQLRFKDANLLERLLGKAVGRYYEAMDKKVCDAALEAAASRLGCEVSEIEDGEPVFGLGFKDSFASEKLRHRIDGFRNQYGFCRNIAFVALVSSILFFISACKSGTGNEWAVAGLSFAIFVAMFARYMKFLATFHAEVIRSLE